MKNYKLKYITKFQVLLKIDVFFKLLRGSSS